MLDRQAHIETARASVMATVDDFYISARLDNGTVVDVPLSYQIAEPGFRPFEKGKGSPEALQARFDEVVAEAAGRNISLGLESSESVAKLLIQEGLGTDCSNLAFRGLRSLHERLGLVGYEHTVLWPLERVQHFHETAPFWKHAKDKEKKPRDFTAAELDVLQGTGTVSIEWISSVFGNDLEFIAGSAQMCSDDSSVSVEPAVLVPGDIVAFQSAASGVVSHLGLIDEITRDDGSTRVNFWHSWHTRDFNGGGVRSDFVVVEQTVDAPWHFSHQGLNDPARYGGYDFRRPNAIAQLLDEPAGVS